MVWWSFCGGVVVGGLLVLACFLGGLGWIYRLATEHEQAYE